ncbi:conserved Plasmodium protein, unknown function [Plasmodium chabaudi chabaudi]|uniref:Uncharacterized protein n=1 Tax=Plasmodium chabaudi chabaudi TaxID=31271 RepID=A0A4V0KAG7_PLACU|nr:conserved Plasmodium protein, unknown function [Plasmodium chabaudi chabaudi]VTZ69590.1 conserved Plasmodium protein, unknown function [Plasmodium chabaudi chabaudi]|eukprot:XP_738641.2 conserved Plasmodium protein, unknown function [Plasmodium chabaudi chabaudi]
MRLSGIRRKVDPLLIVSKRLPSYLKKEKINLSKTSKNNNDNSNKFNKKHVKYNQIPAFVQDIIKFTKKNKYNYETDDVSIDKNKIIYFNNLLNEIEKNKNVLTSTLIHDIYQCLYKLNYLKIDIICNLFSILINNTIDFSNLKGYVNCNFKELINITQYLYHFQNICKKNIHSILYNNKEYYNLKVVQRFVKENGDNINFDNNSYKNIIYTNIYNYIAKYDQAENIDILLHSIIKANNHSNRKGEKQIGEIPSQSDGLPMGLNTQCQHSDQIKILEKNCPIKCGIIESSDCSNNVYTEEDSKKIESSNLLSYTHSNAKSVKEGEEEFLIEYINSFYKLNDMFTFILNKVLNYFNENTNLFDFYNLKLLFFYLGKYKKFDINLIEKISNKLIEEIENIKTNHKLVSDNNAFEENKKYNYANNNQRKKKKKKYINTFSKIDSKEFLIIPYTIGVSMNTHFNNYLIEYVNIYILSLINSRINCDVVNIIYCLVGYKYIMIIFFIMFNIFKFKEKTMQDINYLNKYNTFLKRIIKNKVNISQIYSEKLNIISEKENEFAHNINGTSPNPNAHKKVEAFFENELYNYENEMNNNCRLEKNNFNLKNQEENANKNINQNNNINNHNCSRNIKIDPNINDLINPDYVFNFLLKEFEINVNKISLINTNKNSLNYSYDSKQLEEFYIYYKNIFYKVYHYSIFLLNKYDIKDMLKIYQNLKSISLNDDIINNIYTEVLCDKITLNSPNNQNASSLINIISGK